LKLHDVMLCNARFACKGTTYCQWQVEDCSIQPSSTTPNIVLTPITFLTGPHRGLIAKNKLPLTLDRCILSSPDWKQWKAHASGVLCIPLASGARDYEHHWQNSKAASQLPFIPGS